MMLIAVLCAYIGAGIMAAVLDYWDFEDMMYDYNKWVDRNDINETGTFK